ncbi:MAG: DUF456 domain-containing protein [Alkalibacterium gilvum]|uniref:DUF456 domain-containing protein n=1 Tax=Alkalibacterium gilvum TaxID=1130080 RepID=A0A1H6UR80_9LACT|nr:MULTISPECIES: DUF456 family protein [Alkalibacterium]MDN6294042.1 DUF456 family protein [Alkalibacterium sp.]MDN6295460.1 DUF456 family protein [Alkalibacterium sp.]MDN6729693.1 DUF456 family protein [Alkalibacterium sp.]SEI94913.1 hypothetical protein SAMN04488113_13615 [Alkalibacterium gilvum]
MDILLWFLVVSFFIVSFIGLVFPILPSVFAVWGGFLIYHFFINSSTLTVLFWVSMVALTLILLVADIFTNSMAVKRFGGSKLSERVAAISVILGVFIYPPFGIVIVPFTAVIIVEYWKKKNFSLALNAAIGTLIGFLSGKIAEGMIQLIMISWFFILVWF